MLLNRRKFLGVIVLLGSSPAARADLYDDYINSTSKSPFVAFLARSPQLNSWTGHAFVAIGVDIDASERVYERILGYYPKDTSTLNEVKATFTKVTGDLTSTLADISWTTEYRISVNEAQHKAAVGIADKWMSTDPAYSLLANQGKNCNSFVSEVATAIGLKVPSGAGTTFPYNFIPKLKDANP